MGTLTIDQFKDWMEMYGKASQENDTKASSELFAPDAEYYETPFDEPIRGREAIYQYWERGAQTLKDKSSSFEILTVKGNFGIARWQSKFTSIESGKRFALDCLFVVAFDEDAKCKIFREWWHIREIEAYPNQAL